MDKIRYEKIGDLPEPLQNTLPKKAQEIYLEAYRENYEDYKPEQGGEMEREGVAHRNAMQVVMQSYRLDYESGNWYRRGHKAEEVDEDEENLLEEALDFVKSIMNSDNN